MQALASALQALDPSPVTCNHSAVPTCRQVKERQAEDHLFGDKEKFVTAAFKRKQEEERKWLEEQEKK